METFLKKKNKIKVIVTRIVEEKRKKVVKENEGEEKNQVPYAEDKVANTTTERSKEPQIASSS